MGGSENETWEEEVYYTPRSQGRDRGVSQREDVTVDGDIQHPEDATSIHQEAKESGAAAGLSHCLHW